MYKMGKIMKAARMCRERCSGLASKQAGFGFAVSTRLAFLLIIAHSSCALHGSSNTLSADEISFNSYFERPIVIHKAVFEKEVFLESVPTAARKQRFQIKWDQENYFLSVDGIHGGRVNGVKWEVHANALTISDKKHNVDGSPLDMVERVTLLTANILPTMGVFEMVRGTAVWQQDARRLVGEKFDGGQLSIEFGYADGVPIVASITELNSGQSIGTVEYFYSADFHNGKMPFQLIRYGEPDAKNKTNKLFCVTMHELVLGTNNIPLNEMEPWVALRDTLKTYAMYSNSVLALPRFDGLGVNA